MLSDYTQQVAYSIVLDEENNVYLAGYAEDSSGDKDFLIAVYSTSQSKYYSDVVDLGSDDIARDIALGYLKDIVVAGYSGNFSITSSGNISTALVRYEAIDSSSPSLTQDSTFGDVVEDLSEELGYSSADTSDDYIYGIGINDRSLSGSYNIHQIIAVGKTSRYLLSSRYKNITVMSFVSDVCGDGVQTAGEECDDGNTADDDGCSEFCYKESLWYVDADGDGYGDVSLTEYEVEQPTGYVDNGEDCDDSDSSINPGETEVCDGSDNDCDGDVDEDDASDATTWYLDADGDGYGDVTCSTVSCEAPEGYVSDDSDCDDSDSANSPEGTEVCDGVDNDCDGSADESDASDASTWYQDSDGDGYGTSSSSQSACSQPTGYVSNASDCNDSDSDISPDAEEVCDGVDNDCNGDTDEDDASDASTWYLDSDGDGYGTSSSSQSACSQPTGYVSNASDCNDSDSDISPDAEEVCDDVDNDCNGDTDDDDASVTGQSTWYADFDGDGYGDASDSQESCAQPADYVDNDEDCNDDESEAYPGNSEVCDDSIDNDCDDSIDEDCSSDDGDDGDDDSSVDSDNDGIVDADDTDDDNDGIPDSIDDDDDGDGIKDSDEMDDDDSGSATDNQSNSTGNGSGGCSLMAVNTKQANPTFSLFGLFLGLVLIVRRKASLAVSHKP